MRMLPFTFQESAARKGAFIVCVINKMGTQSGQGCGLEHPEIRKSTWWTFAKCLTDMCNCRLKRWTLGKLGPRKFFFCREHSWIELCGLKYTCKGALKQTDTYTFVLCTNVISLNVQTAVSREMITVWRVSEKCSDNLMQGEGRLFCTNPIVVTAAKMTNIFNSSDRYCAVPFGVFFVEHLQKCIQSMQLLPLLWKTKKSNITEWIQPKCNVATHVVKLCPN